MLPPQGSMPTDGNLFLENIPKGRQYLLTALSVFFSIGSVVAAAAALVLIPSHSCVGGATVPCDVDVQNKGWKYLLISLGVMVRIPGQRIHI
jgi:hypothetical protein